MQDLGLRGNSRGTVRDGVRRHRQAGGCAINITTLVTLVTWSSDWRLRQGRKSTRRMQPVALRRRVVRMLGSVSAPPSLLKNVAPSETDADRVPLISRRGVD